ncbi:MAG: CCA tRNA nucleotidyltransferase [Alphaproteobacteria bacterium]|nr:CCA tRNA nucleotidyltransferase [Alphaproteobacteria bacterium]
MKIENPIWQTCPAVKEIIRLLKGKARLVGGCVRDSLLGKIPDDIDMATEFKPAAVIGILKKRGFTVLPTGFLYGTVTVLTKDLRFPTIEITTLRKDLRHDRRRPKVTYTKSWQEDSMRRDFTFNALYADFDGTVYDFCGGLEDLKNGRVRFIGDPAERIREDQVRILRYFRFLSVFRDEPDMQTIEACQAVKSKLFSERMRREFFRLLSVPNAMYGLKIMQQAGLLKQYCSDPDLDSLERLLQIKPMAAPLLRLLVLTDLSEEAAAALADLWQLPKAPRREIMHIASFDRTKEPADYTENDFFRFALYFKAQERDLVFSLLQAKEPDRHWEKIQDNPALNTVHSKPFRFSRTDLSENIEKNTAKKLVAQVYEYWLSTNGRAGRKELLQYAQKLNRILD